MQQWIVVSLEVRHGGQGNLKERQAWSGVSVRGLGKRRGRGEWSFVGVGHQGTG